MLHSNQNTKNTFYKNDWMNGGLSNIGLCRMHNYGSTLYISASPIQKREESYF